MKLASRRFARFASCSGFGLGLVLGSPAVEADVVLNIAAPDLYSYKVSHVPDFDQRRLALPGGGSQYCVPTATTNWTAYIANHGVSWVPPGFGWWQSQSRYDDATNALATLGSLMNTHPSNGTNGAGAHAGFHAWLPFPLFIVTHQYPGAYSMPNFHTVAQHALGGALVIPVVGWYEDDGVTITRNGGHALSLTRLQRSGDALVIGWRDPAADDGDDTKQSLFSTETYGVEHRIRLRSGGVLPVAAAKVLNYGSAYIDEVYAIYPIFVLTCPPDLFTIEANFVLQTFGMPFQPYVEYVPADSTQIKDLTIYADAGSYIYLAEPPEVGDPARLWQMDPVTGDSTRIDVGLTDPTRVIVGRRRDLYVLDGDRLVCINVDRPEPEVVVEVTPPTLCDALCTDDDADEIVLLSRAGHQVIRYPYHLDAVPDARPIPPEVPIAGKVSLACSPTDGALWMVSDASDSLYRMTQPVGGGIISEEIAHPALADPRAVDVNDAGHVFVSSEGQLLEFEYTAAAGWVLAANPLFQDVAAGEFLQVARSRTNYDPQLHGGEEWYDVPPVDFGDPEFDCPADLNQSGAVEFSDLLLFLAAWGPCPPDAFCDADFDYSGDVGFNDLLVVLSAWGPCG